MSKGQNTILAVSTSTFVFREKPKQSLLCATDANEKLGIIECKQFCIRVTFYKNKRKIVLGEGKEEVELTNRVILKKHFNILFPVKWTNQHSASSSPSTCKVSHKNTDKNVLSTWCKELFPRLFFIYKQVLFLDTVVYYPLL